MPNALAHCQAVTVCPLLLSAALPQSAYMAHVLPV